MKCTVVCYLVAFLASISSAQNIGEFAIGSNQFTADIYSAVSQRNPGNFITSPLSAELVLALAQSGAKGPTGEEIRQVLHLSGNLGQTENSIRNLLDEFKNSQSYTLKAANKIYTKSSTPLKKSFNLQARTVYGADVENVDFTKSAEAAAKINQWVEENTNNKIRDLVSPSVVQDLEMLLVNALYFKANFSRPFEYHSHPSPFHVSVNQKKNVSTMYKTSSYNYYESVDLDAKYLEIPFRGGDASLVIVLPNKIDGLANLEKQIQRIYQEPKFNEEVVFVSLPKFRVESSTELTDYLKKLGISTAFSGNADFSGMAGEKGQLALSKVVQKAFIDVNENGVEASAATYAGFVLLSGVSFLEDPKPFKADHPFLFYIKVKDVILFTGRVADP